MSALEATEIVRQCYPQAQLFRLLLSGKRTSALAQANFVPSGLCT
jgi:hypothetical protein